jgi:outer membrane receptor for ferrienterochelin and colicin
MSRRRWGPGWVGPLVFFCLLGFSRSAWADPKDDAKRHFVAGLQAAAAKDFPLALEEFLAAQDTYPHPASLYNIARAYTDLGELDKALAYYRLFRDAAPDKAADIDPVIAVMEARIRQQQAPPPAVEATAAPSARAAGAASAEEVERLRSIAAELERLSVAIAERAAAPEAPVVDGSGPALVPEAGPAHPAPVDVAPIPAGDFVSDAYERIVVTASRYGQDPLDSPSTVSVLTADDIRQSGATNIPDLLRQVVGVEVMELGAGKPDVSIRGFNRELSNKILVLVDGRSINLDALGTPIWVTLPISMEEIERIEVIRGPGSAIYGANAVTGVINLITKVPGEGKNTVKVEGGAPGYSQGNAMVTGREGRTAWRFGGGFQKTGRWSTSGTPETNSAVYSPLMDDQSVALDVVRADGRIDRSFGEQGLLSVSGGYSEGLSEVYVIGALGEYSFPFSHAFARGDIAWGPLHLRSFYDTENAETGAWVGKQGGTDTNVDIDSDVFDTELEWHGNFKTGRVEHRLSAGLGYRFKSLSWGYLEGAGEPITENHSSVFVQEEARIGRLAAVGSLRVDNHPLVALKDTISPRASAIVRVADRTSVRATVGTAFRAPTFLESYLDLAQLSPATGIFVLTKGNKELLPERVFTAEAGVHDESTAWHRADVAVYLNRVTDLIFVSALEPELNFYDPDRNGFSAGTTTFENLPPVYTAYGLEADSRFFPVDGLDLYLNANLEQIREDDAGSVVDVGDASTLKVNGGVLYRSPWRLDGSVNLNYLSAQTWRLREYDDQGQLQVTENEIPARLIPSARIALRPFSDDRVELAATAWNIPALVSDEARFREHPKGQLVGGRLFGSLQYRF